MGSHLIRQDRADDHIPEPLHLQGITDACIGCFAPGVVDIAHRPPACPFAPRFDFNMHIMGLQNSWIDYSSNSARIMYRSSWKAKLIAIPAGKEIQQVCREGRNRSMSLAQAA